MIIAVSTLSLLAAGFGPQVAGPSVEPPLGKAADNKIYAQTVANRIMSDNPD